MKRTLWVIAVASVLLCAMPSEDHPATAGEAPPNLTRLTLEIPTIRSLAVSYEGGELFERHLVEPTALASGDLDEDGVPDLLCGYRGPERGIVTLHRGNIDAIFAHSAAARQRRAKGSFTDAPFLSPATVFAVPGAPDFLAAGDFDNDGHIDVVVATAGEAQLHLMTGDGRGGLWPAMPVGLPGLVTALTAGEINRADGLVDLVVGVEGPTGPAAMVFEGPEGALRSVPEIVTLPASPKALLLGRLGDGPWQDLAVAAGYEVLIVQGRDRGMVLGDSHRSEAAPAVVERIPMPSRIEDLAWGDFASEPVAIRELALALEDGTIRLLARTASQPDGAVERRRVTRGEIERGPQTERSWTTIGQLDMFATSSHIAASPSVVKRRLVPLRLSGSSTEDLAVFDTADRRLHVLTGMSRESRDATSLSNAGGTATLELDEPPVAVLPMRLNADALSDMVLLISTESAPILAQSAPRATIDVDSNLDTAIAGDGVCTLREAIANANSDGDTTLEDCPAGSGADTITFNIGGGGAKATIALNSLLPIITDALTIDGTTQACVLPPCIVLNGSSAGTGPGLELSAGSCSIRGLVIQEFSGQGILATSSANFIEGNYIGTDEGGTLYGWANTSHGVQLDDATSNNTVGGTTISAQNVISANGEHGILVSQNASDNTVSGNLIGTDVSGTADLGNWLTGVRIYGAPNNTIGGTTAGAGNLISGNNYGVTISLADATGNLVLGNLIGTDATITTALGNTEDGVNITSAARGNTVGGAAALGGNIISGNGRSGVLLSNAATGNQVLGNFIGTDISGATALGNVGDGVWITNAPANVIGGTSEGSGNLISGNDYGVRIYGPEATGNHVQGNLIGTDITGTVALGNDLDGVQIDAAPGNTIGGDTAGARNIISANGDEGIEIINPASSGNEVLGNFIGTDINGTAALGNTWSGVLVYSAPNNSIGGTSERSSNLISGNNYGVIIYGLDATGNHVVGNYIGTDINGTADLGNTNNGVYVYSAPNNTIGGTPEGSGNLISGNDYGVVIFLADATGNQVQGNLIGTDITGTSAVPNLSDGILISQAPGNTVGGASADARNIISGNRFGVQLFGLDATGNQVQGNLIGTDITGTSAVPNLLDGILIQQAPGNTVGGASADARNIISGNDRYGIQIYELTASGNNILGNYIGTDINGTAGLGNTSIGVFVASAPNNSIGGTSEGSGNLISGNDYGVIIYLADATGNQVQGNLIGTDITGTSAVPNLSDGIVIQQAPSNTVGGASADARNIISGNDGDGVFILESSDANLVQGNYIGTDVTGTQVLGNAGDGIEIQSSNNTVGGTTPGARNVIAYNVEGGVLTISGVDNAILGNSIFSNGLMGIDLGASDGVTPNDTNDPDTGPNNLQNFPVLTLASATSTPDLTVDGTLNSIPDTDFRIEFFANSICDSSGCGEGERFLGFTDQTTDGSGDVSFSLVLTAPVANGESIVATATDPGGSTSEFGACFTATCSSLVTFGETIMAPNKDTLGWTTATDIRFVKGNLSDVSSYTTTGSGWIPVASSLDISGDNPDPGSGLYYLVESLGCGSWQSSPGAEPGRDAAIP